MSTVGHPAQVFFANCKDMLLIFSNAACVLWQWLRPCTEHLCEALELGLTAFEVALEAPERLALVQEDLLTKWELRMRMRERMSWGVESLPNFVTRSFFLSLFFLRLSPLSRFVVIFHIRCAAVRPRPTAPSYQTRALPSSRE